MLTQNSIITALLLDRRFHWLRYASLCVAMLVFSISEITFNYSMLLGDAAHRFVVILLISNCFLCKVALLAALVEVLVPRILNRGRYGLFTITLIAVSTVFVVLQYVIEGGICAQSHASQDRNRQWGVGRRMQPTHARVFQKETIIFYAYGAT